MTIDEKLQPYLVSSHLSLDCALELMQMTHQNLYYYLTSMEDFANTVLAHKKKYPKDFETSITAHSKMILPHISHDSDCMICLWNTPASFGIDLHMHKRNHKGHAFEVIIQKPN